MNATITPPELNALPPLRTLRTLWPQFFSGLFFLGTVVGVAVNGTPTAWAVMVLCGLVFGITCSYLIAMRSGNKMAMASINWAGGFVTALYFSAISHDLLPVAVLCVIEGVVYALSASNRRLMLAGSLAAFGVLCGMLLMTELARHGIFHLGLSLSPALTSGMVIFFVLGIGADILQRLWRFHDRIETTVSNLQHTNVELESAQQALQQRLNERTRLLEISRAVSSTQDLASLLKNTLAHLKSVVDYGHASVLMLQDGDLRALSSAGDIPLAQNQLNAPLCDTPHRAAVISTRQPVLIDNLGDDAQLTRLIQGGLVPGEASQLQSVIGSWLGVPLTVRGEVIGILSITHPTSGHFTPHDSDMALAFANQVAGIIDSAHLQEEATKSLVHAERNRLARELHDSVSQSLFGIVLGTRTALDQLEKSTEVSRTALLYSVDLANTALAEMRALIFTLRPETLERDGLLVALQKQIDMLAPRHNIQIRLEAGTAEPDVAMDVKEALYRIATEAVQNAIRHAAATDVVIRLALHSGHISLEVQDNGKGFDPNADYREHLGLKSMRERAAELAGTLHIDSRPGAGARVTVVVPLIATSSVTHSLSAIV